MAKASSKKSLEFLTIMTTVVGTMIGAGIYVKNDNQDGHVLGLIQQPYMALIAWAIIGIIVMAAIMIFMEVASSTAENGNGTVSNWTRMFWNRKVGSIISIYYIFVYLPVNYGFFSVLIIQYILTAAGAPNLSHGDLVALYMCVGIFFICCFSYMNTYQRATGKKVQIIGTFVKFIPLILVLLAIFVPDTTWAVFFNKTGEVAKNGTITGHPYSTSFEDVQAMRFFSGFVPILFAFNGFIYAANMQKETENKDVVAKGILVGVIFTTIFYIIISVSLFLGSTDGSVVSFFNYLFHGFHTQHQMINGVDTPIIPTSGAAVVISNVILACVCLMGLNSYTLTGTNFYNTDANEGIIFSGNRFIKQSASGMVQMTMGLVAFVPLTIVAIFTGHEQNPGYYMDLAGNAGAILAFIAYDTLLICAVVNRFTGKVKVKKLNNKVFWPCAIFAVTTLTLIDIYSVLDFFSAFSHVEGGSKFSLANVLAMGISIGIIAILWIANEIAFKIKPFDQAKIVREEKIYLEQKRLKETRLKVKKTMLTDIDLKIWDQFYDDYSQVINSSKEKQIKKVNKAIVDLEKQQVRQAIETKNEEYKNALLILQTREKQVRKELDIIIKANKKNSEIDSESLKQNKQLQIEELKKEIKQFKQSR